MHIPFLSCLYASNIRLIVSNLSCNYIPLLPERVRSHSLLACRNQATKILLRLQGINTEMIELRKLWSELAISHS
jgi:hypothetical protein